MASQNVAVRDTEDVGTSDTSSSSFKKTFCRCIFPPRGFLAKTLSRTFIIVTSWLVMWCIIGSDLLPGGNLFGIFTVLVCSSLGGFLASHIPCLALPSLFGMLVVGFLLRNLPHIDVAKHIDSHWSATLRSISLVVILIRSGLELDPLALKRLKFTCIRLAFGPCVCEAVTVAVTMRYLVDMPWLWGLQLGFVLGAVSPAVVVPQLLVLQEKGYGVEQGIPTLVMAASSCDDVLAISMFGVFVGIAFSQAHLEPELGHPIKHQKDADPTKLVNQSQGSQMHSCPITQLKLGIPCTEICRIVFTAKALGNIYFNIFRGPIELLLGIAIGLIVGFICWYLPHKEEPDRSRVRFVLLSCFALLSLFGWNAVELSGAGALGILVMSTIAAYGWGTAEKIEVAEAMAVVWEFFQPLLFGLIGTEVSLDYLNSKFIAKCVGALSICVSVRMLVTFLLMAGNNLTNKEKLFVAIAWLPKATVQAAIGSISLDIARQRGYTGKMQEEYGIQIVTMAVLSILLTAPIGAAAIAITGPHLMRRAEFQLEMETMDGLITEPRNADVS